MTEPDDSAEEGESTLPHTSAARTAKLASLPLGIAGRAVSGWGRRLGGRSSDDVNAELSARAAEQLFDVLGTLKGGAMKFGQVLSVFEAAIPDAYAAPYREALTKLQTAAPPMSTRQARRVLTEQLGTSWRRRFAEFGEEPMAAASIGQVHRAVWHDGREVAVKIQYPGADEALRSDLRQLMRFSRLIQAIVPGTEVKPLLNELADRMDEELDYRIEAEHQRAFATAFADDPEFVVPRVVASAPKVIVTEWVTGTPLSAIIADGEQARRNEAGRLLTEFLYSAPARASRMHSDPHPGNFMITEDNRLCVIDFGACLRLPDGIPYGLGEITRLALEARPAELMAALREHRFVRPDADVAADDVLAYLAPFSQPLAGTTFRFTRRWMQKQATRVGDARGSDFQTARSLNLPAEYLMIHRAAAGNTGILCQLEAEFPIRAIAERWIPGFLPPEA
ncbi:AarF/ABC1/UbiB kinase family protein [Haloechinothrix sp. YIM 98757]|uniref:AarF/ABC1/UbiB kinase family protein n=1 Tax=Haloechinothrix aidingensis TaxID=2752311 RepID=A0A838ACX6_9PSEU|nr:AarF/ABC1/UbiB kinase family protein [Haloechinothrix aidingensis]